jgi:hypothetical protein
VRLDRLRVELLVPPETSPADGADLYSMLTISAALLLGRLGYALVHSAAVVSPNGTALLLTGDARSGKSTTTVNLITRGWSYLSDDQVILRKDSGGVSVLGLLRPFHLDQGWGHRRPVARRRAVDPATLGPGRRLKAAPLGSLVFPRVEAAAPTALRRLAPADAVAALVRQSPWLLADPASAPRILELLRLAAESPGFVLSLGLDTFSNAELLEEVLVSATGDGSEKPPHLAPARFAARRAAIAIGQANAPARR